MDKIIFECARCGRKVAAVFGQAVTMRCACGHLTFNLPKPKAKKKEPVVEKLAEAMTTKTAAPLKKKPARKAKKKTAKK